MGDTRVNSLYPVPNNPETNAPARPKALLVTLFVCALLAFAVGICVFAHVNVLVRLGNLGGGICLGSGALLALVVCVINARSGATIPNTTAAPKQQPLPAKVDPVTPLSSATYDLSTSAHAVSCPPTASIQSPAVPLGHSTVKIEPLPLYDIIRAYYDFGTTFVTALRRAIPLTRYDAVEVFDALSVPGNEIIDPVICSPILIKREALSTYLDNGIADLANNKPEGTIKIECLLILKTWQGFFHVIHYQKESHFKKCADGTYGHYVDGDIAPVLYRNIAERDLPTTLTGIMQRMTLIAPFTSSFIV